MRILESGDEHALICEDDITLSDDFDEALSNTLRHSESWDIVRLCGLNNYGRGHALDLSASYSLSVCFVRLKGAGAYLLNRAAAERFVQKLLPMKLPYDHAFDREWIYGLRAVAVSPFPISQTEAGFRTSIQGIQLPFRSP